MKIIFDVMGGDNAPYDSIRAASLILKELNVSVVLVGDESIIKNQLSDLNCDIDKFEIINAIDCISMDENPITAIKKKINSSMVVGLRLLSEGGGDAFVSAGNTGALVAGATLIVGRIKGIRRAALATVLPGQNNVLVVDSGANIECTPMFLEQFGIMGSFYMNEIMGVPNPRVGLINIGIEETKGNTLTVQAHKLLKNANINYIGNIEPRDIPFNKVDVIVCDGFTGNIILKLLEGAGVYFSGTLKNIFKSSLAGKIAALGLRKKIQDFKNENDYSKYGGAPLLGIKKTVIKAHGSSNVEAFFNAVRQAKIHVNSTLLSEIGRVCQ